VLALDADYVLTDEFLSEIVQCEPDPKTTGYAVRFKLLIHGQALRSGLYPPVIVLYRARLGQYVQDGHTQRLRIEGTIGTCEGYILHDDRKALSRWLWAQERYSLLECDRLLEASWRSLSIKNKFRYSAVIMPWLVPLYCLFVRGGILDGWRGVFYALQRAIVEGLLAIRIIDARIAKRVPRKP
jgi:hypothetical protein